MCLVFPTAGDDVVRVVKLCFIGNFLEELALFDAKELVIIFTGVFDGVSVTVGDVFDFSDLIIIILLPSSTDEVMIALDFVDLDLTNFGDVVIDGVTSFKVTSLGFVGDAVEDLMFFDGKIFLTIKEELFGGSFRSITFGV